jgi:hypothetical protein
VHGGGDKVAADQLRRRSGGGGRRGRENLACTRCGPGSRTRPIRGEICVPRPPIPGSRVVAGHSHHEPRAPPIYPFLDS